jgi:hypothetical protein
MGEDLDVGVTRRLCSAGEDTVGGRRHNHSWGDREFHASLIPEASSCPHFVV